MPVELRVVLPAVEQIFPGVQQIPLERIRPNPDNPGPPITEDQIAEQAANLEVSPLRNPIKVMPDPAKPLAEGVRLHAEKPNLKADGQPWTPGDFNWVILSGELRYRAFGRLNRASIPAFVLNPNPEEAAEIIHQDNDVRDRGWFAAYQSIENLVKANPNLTQREVAARLKLHIPQVNRALQLLPLLNPESKALIVTNCNNQNKGNKGISESVAAQLADLGPGTGLKRGVKAAGAETQRLWPYPAIPGETQDLVRRALEVAIDRGMTQAGVKGLVTWVKAGNAPEDFGTQPAPKAKAAPVSGSPMPLGAPGAAPSASAPAVSAQAGVAPTGDGFKEAVLATSAWVRKHGPSLFRPRSSQPRPTGTPGILSLARGLGRVVHWLRQPLQAALRNELKRAARWAVALALLWLAYWVIQWGFRVGVARQAAVPLPVKEALVRPAAAQPVTQLVPQTLNRKVSADQVGSRSVDSSQPANVKNGSGAPANGEQALAITAQPQKAAGPVAVTAVAAPAVQPTKTQGDDLGKKIGDGVKGLNDAVNTANNATSAVDKAKNLLGL